MHFQESPFPRGKIGFSTEDSRKLKPALSWHSQRLQPPGSAFLLTLSSLRVPAVPDYPSSPRADSGVPFNWGINAVSSLASRTCLIPKHPGPLCFKNIIPSAYDTTIQKAVAGASSPKPPEPSRVLPTCPGRSASKLSPVLP